MSTEPPHIRKMDRTGGRLMTATQEAIRAAFEAGYEEGRRDAKKGLPHRFRTSSQSR